MAAIALCSAVYFPPRLKFSIPLIGLFISDEVLNYYYGAPLLDPQILCRYLALALIGLIGLSLQNRALSQIAAARINRRIDAVLSDYQCIFLAERSWLRKNFGGSCPGCYRRTASIQRDAELDVFRNSVVSDLVFHGSLCCLHEFLGAK